jgi:hypothetical protein
LRIIQALRTTQEQEDLYAFGRTKPGKIVTNADGVRNLSRHQKQVLHGEDSAHAVDFGIFEDGKYVTDARAYKPLKSLIMDAGLEPSSAPWDVDHCQCIVVE